MNKRLRQVNKHIQRTLGEIIQRDVDLPVDVMVTLSRVDTTPNLKSSTVWLYVSPLNRSDEVMEILQSQMYDIQGELNRALDLRPLPRIRLEVDAGAEYSQQINDTIQQLKEEAPDDTPE